MATNKKTTLAKPSGLDIKRKGNKFTFSWHKGDSNYTDQDLKWAEISDGVEYKETLPDNKVGKNTTSKSVTVDLSTYYPNKHPLVRRVKVGNQWIIESLGEMVPCEKLDKIRFWVRGEEKSTETGNKMIRSDWAQHTFTVKNPYTPSLTASLSGTYAHTTTFYWGIDYGSSNEQESTHMFSYYEYYTILKEDCNVVDGSKIKWDGATHDTTTSTSRTITESISFANDKSYTRFFKIRAVGPNGHSSWAHAKHVYAQPKSVTNVKASATALSGNSGYKVYAEWTADSSYSHPIDSVTVQYAVAVPASSYTDVNGTRKLTLSVPVISGETDAITIKDTKNKDGVNFTIGSRSNPDECIFVRVNTKHDDEITYGQWVFASGAGYGDLAAPTSLSATVDNNYLATVTVTNASQVTASFVGVYYRDDNNANGKLVGVWPSGQSQAITVQLPTPNGSSNYSLGVRAIAGDYSPASTSGETGVITYKTSNIKMQSSGIIWDTRAVPKPPTHVELSSPRQSVVRVTWDWTWDTADGVELSWADHDDAWESTDEPATYDINATRVGAWNVAGLDVGTWYFRVRLFKYEGDSITYGTYSDIKSIKLTATPDTPVLTISPNMVPIDSSFSCYWAYAAEEGDEQIQADICEATIDNSTGEVTYGEPFAKADNEQFKTLNVSDLIADLGWVAGSQHYLAVKVISFKGDDTDNWSVPKPVTVLAPVDPPTVTTSLVNTSIDIDTEEGETDTYLSLIELPLEVTASGVDSDATITYIIERAAAYHMATPDENDINGFEGETVVVVSYPASTSPISISMNDLLIKLDDGGRYNLLVTAEDSNGQVSEPTSISFIVNWAHQAQMPTANVVADNENAVSYITPLTPSEDYSPDDVCDIYRLSADKPELIVSGGNFGVTYVDPYPALGSMGGHRVVYRTTNGDYITDKNEFAWRNYMDTIDIFATIIDFGGDRVVLPYDLSLSSSWNKDFTETKYLGGSVQGDWNPAVSKTGTIKTRVAVEYDPELIEQMRRLAVYSGVCHVRTPDGSSYSANVNVTEDREEKKINMIASFTLTITRVDSEGFDGLTYDLWHDGGE